ncbi:MAG TPA: sigma-70 family RNA polymerase sigma factor [Actinomycetota bacterium]|nr:sigma-70 family RNA polymerase sigma factor [Actinomycetota bacterium]
MTERSADGVKGLGADGFEALVADLSPSLYRFARTLVRGDRDAAEDLVQETFLRAFQRRDSFRGEASARTWLHRILHNLAVDRARRPDREVPMEDVESKWRDDAYTVDSGTVVERAETREELEDALVRLPFIYRSAVLLHDVEQWTAKEVADAQGIELPAAKQRLRRGRMMLVTALAGAADRRSALRGVPLRCWDARRRVSDYLDGELPGGERSLVEEHLSVCPTCPPLYASLVGVKARLGGLRDADAVIPPGLATRIQARLQAHREPGGG